MARLESLKFEDATVTDGGFVRLATLPQLKQLIACCPGVTDQGAQTVLQLPSLQKLRFTNALITDQTVSLLPGLNQLVWLALHGCKGVTDAAEKALAKMTRLKRLSLRSTSITPNVAERLRLALPDCEVKFHAGPF